MFPSCIELDDVQGVARGAGCDEAKMFDYLWETVGGDSTQ
jgi:hypothetical protein